MLFTSQFNILQRSLIVVVFIGLFFRSLSIVELDIWCFVINVYVDSFESRKVIQKGVYTIMSSPADQIVTSDFYLDYSREKDYNTK